MNVVKVTGLILLAVVLAVLIIGIGAVLFLNFWPSVGKAPDGEARRALGRRSKQHRGGRFRNDAEIRTLTGRPPASSDRKKPKKTIPARTPSLLPEPGADDLTLTWLGHSSFLLQIGGKNILVDPVLSGRSSPVGFAGPKRFSELPMTVEKLPGIDAVLLSHDHYDHLDYGTIRAIRDKASIFVAPLGLDAVLSGWGVPMEKIRTLDWWESITLDGLSSTLTPSQHFSGRNPLKGNSTLWGGFYLESGDRRVYYTGDGGYNTVFSAVHERLGAPDLMIAECGQYDPSWANIHMFPEQTVQAGTDAGASWLIPVHWGSFCICKHAWDDSVRRVTKAAKASGLNVATPRIGETVIYDDIASHTENWWESCE